MIELLLDQVPERIGAVPVHRLDVVSLLLVGADGVIIFFVEDGDQTLASSKDAQEQLQQSGFTLRIDLDVVAFAALVELVAIDDGDDFLSASIALLVSWVHGCLLSLGRVPDRFYLYKHSIENLSIGVYVEQRTAV